MLEASRLRDGIVPLNSDQDQRQHRAERACPGKRACGQQLTQNVTSHASRMIKRVVEDENRRHKNAHSQISHSQVEEQVVDGGLHDAALQYDEDYRRVADNVCGRHHGEDCPVRRLAVHHCVRLTGKLESLQRTH